MIQVAPSILAADFLHLEKDVEIVNEYADLFHLDIMDGVFVPNISFGFPVVEAIAKKARKPMDVHLMIVHPENYVERFAKVGASYISFHYEAARENAEEIIEKIQALGVKAGIVINPDCPVQAIFPLLPKVDYVLIMSVFAGFGGQKFIPESLERARTVREKLDSLGRRDVPIEMDGGIGPANAAEVIRAGVQMLVAGSAVFKSENPQETIKALRNA
ncbi:MAG: ribulose-phosphate 3-epimerase [Bacteroidales bacterium]|jgi:ribulose-phosphate 3-epimerase|nr:ribulose-phosphate 3-epimerase [Bacteroidales bacterium]